MKTKWLSKEETYDGTQLEPLRNYLSHGLLGNSIVAWVGPCQISFDHMVDGEDLREQAAIQGDRMLHFVMEIFDRDLFAGVACQRVFASLAKDIIESRVRQSKLGFILHREGDDLYWEGRKLSISIATRSVNSILMHFAMNLTNKGTPVPTCALTDDFGLTAEDIAQNLLSSFAKEYLSILEATWKVKTVGPL